MLAMSDYVRRTIYNDISRIEKDINDFGCYRYNGCWQRCQVILIVDCRETFNYKIV